MTVPVLTAVTDTVREAALVSALERDEHGVTVVRRCVDLADLLAAAGTGTARAVILSADLRRLDREALTRLAVERVAVVALVAAGDEDAERRLRQLGVRQVLPTDAPADRVSSAVLDAVAQPTELMTIGATYAAPRPAVDGSELPPAGVDAEPAAGRLVAVWGPTGAPGRTTVAVGVASEAADLGVPTLLADADCYGGVVAQVLGMVEESPGLAGAARLANNGTLDVPALAELARAVAPRLRVLTGITRAERWGELRPAALAVVWSLARGLTSLTVVDCGFGLEPDDALSLDGATPRRHGATLSSVSAADTVLAVGSADPVGLQRLVRGLGELREAAPDATIRVVVNRVRPGVVGASPQEEIARALDRYAGVRDPVFVPLDVRGLDRALAAGRTLVEVASSSPVRPPLRALAAELAAVTAPAPRRPWVRRLRAGR